MTDRITLPANSVGRDDRYCVVCGIVVDSISTIILGNAHITKPSYLKQLT